MMVARLLILAVSIGLALATVLPAEAVRKCRQPDGSLLSVPDSVACEGQPQRSIEDEVNSRVQQSPTMQRLREEANQAAAEQVGESFVQASAVCARLASGGGGVRAGNAKFKAQADASGKVTMFGTAAARYEYDACMARQGHPLENR